MSEKLAGVYLIAVCRPDGSTSNYVGQSRDFKQRARAHMFNLRRGSHANRHLQAAWDKYGPSSFQFSILEPAAESDDLTAMEERWIGRLDAKSNRGGFNQRIVADSCHGIKKTAESIERSVAGRRGVPLSAAHRAAIGAGNKGRSPTQECLQKAMEARRGKPHPRLGKKHSTETRWKIGATKQAQIKARYLARNAEMLGNS